MFVYSPLRHGLLASGDMPCSSTCVQTQQAIEDKKLELKHAKEVKDQNLQYEVCPGGGGGGGGGSAGLMLEALVSQHPKAALTALCTENARPKAAVCGRRGMSTL